MPQVESLIKEVQPSTDPFDSTTFDPVAFINTQFSNEPSLFAPIHGDSGPPKLDHVLHSCKRNIHGLSEEISKLVREGSAQKAVSERYASDAFDLWSHSLTYGT